MVRNKTENVVFRCSKPDKELIERVASSLNMRPSEYIREVVIRDAQYMDKRKSGANNGLYRKRESIKFNRWTR